MRRPRPTGLFPALALLALLLGALAPAGFGPALTAAHAQEQDPEEERSLFVSFLENQLSTPNRQIRISGIQGVLSSQATIGSITVADREGVWLTIENAAIDWSRSALLLRQRLEIERLAAERIAVSRRPLPEEGLPAPEASPFQVPELPIAVDLDRLEIARLVFGEDVFGLASELTVEGSLLLDGGALDTELAVERLDGPGGQFTLAASYDNATEALAVDLALSEPADGVVANLLDIEGRPPLSLALSGEGPLDDLDLALALDTQGERVLEGIARLRGRAGGIGFAVELSGPIARLVPAAYRDFFGAETALTASGLAKDGGGLRLDALALESAALTLDAEAETGADGFLQRLALEATVAEPGGAPVLLPVAGGETTVGRATLAVDFGGAGAERWTGRLAVDRLTTGSFAAERVALDLDGLAQNLSDPQTRRITFAADGAVTGIVAERADVAEALGDRLALDVSGAWQAGTPLRLDEATLTGNGLAVRLDGSVSDYAFDGDIAVEAESIAPFSGLADRALAGALTLEAAGTVRPLSGAFGLTLDGTARDLRIANEAADSLLGGVTRITGRLARDADGLTAERLSVANDQVELTADGTFASDAADFRFDLALADLALVSEQASGRLTATGTANGADGLIALTFSAEVPEGELAGKRLTGAALGFEGTLQAGVLDGRVAGDAFLDGVRATLEAGLVTTPEGARRLTDLAFSAGGARATGNLMQRADGLFEGRLDIDAPDISTAAALALAEARGALDGTLELSVVDERQDAALEAALRDLAVGDLTIGSADVEATVEALFAVPRVRGTLAARDVTAAGIDIARLAARADRQGEATAFSAEAALDNGTDLATAGRLTPTETGYRLALDEARLAGQGVTARLAEPATLAVAGQTVSFDTLRLDIGGGTLTAAGTIADEIDLSLDIARLPLSVANAVRPDLGLGGTVSGSAAVRGPRESPEVDFDVTGSGLTAAALREAGIAALSVTAEGATRGERLTLDASLTSPDGVRATVRGSAPLGDGPLDLTVDLAAFPLATLDRLAGGQDLAGRVTGSARVAGTLADPDVSFDLAGSGVGAAPLRQAGIAALDVAANGRYRSGTVTLDALSVDGPQGLSLDGRGRVPLTGSGLGVNLAGSVPLALADRFLAERGAQVTGTLTLDVSLTGSLADPVVRGSFAVSGAEAVDPMSNLRLESIALSGRIEGEQVVLGDASAALAAGGTVSASGTISTSAAAGFPADLAIRLDSARYSDGDLVTATVSGRLTLTGPLAFDPLLAGDLSVASAEIVVPESLGGGVADIDVTHIAPPPEVARTLARARADDGTAMPSDRPSVLRLDIRLSAPRRIFVRGRGLDAELGGSVELTGPVTAIRPVGGFELIRGRLSILGQRIVFDEGRVTLVGDLDPFLNFVARIEGADITAFITVTGRVSDLAIEFSSQPELPQEEVLARVIFDRSVGELSPLQLAQLAAAAAELAGGAETSLLGQLRAATGLDDLDVVTDSEGNAAVRAGRYIQENIYLGVEAGARGDTRATINLDITEDLKARGTVGTDGDSSLGVFFEKDY